eukprot:g25701.t1
MSVVDLVIDLAGGLTFSCVLRPDPYLVVNEWDYRIIRSRLDSLSRGSEQHISAYIIETIVNTLRLQLLCTTPDETEALQHRGVLAKLARNGALLRGWDMCRLLLHFGCASAAHTLERALDRTFPYYNSSRPSSLGSPPHSYTAPPSAFRPYGETQLSRFNKKRKLESLSFHHVPVHPPLPPLVMYSPLPPPPPPPPPLYTLSSSPPPLIYPTLVYCPPPPHLPSSSHSSITITTTTTTTAAAAAAAAGTTSTTSTATTTTSTTATTTTTTTTHARTSTTPTGPFKCSVCDSQLTHIGSFKRHMRAHAEGKPFNCSLCGYKCAKSSDLTNHLRTHTGEKPFKCNHCDYKCAHISSLKSHMLIHTGEKRFTCSTCGYKCARSSDLKSHMRVHFGKRSFECPTCGYKFIHSSALKRHMKTQRHGPTAPNGETKMPSPRVVSNAEKAATSGITPGAATNAIQALALMAWKPPQPVQDDANGKADDDEESGSEDEESEKEDSGATNERTEKGDGATGERAQTSATNERAPTSSTTA